MSNPNISTTLEPETPQPTPLPTSPIPAKRTSHWTRLRHILTITSQTGPATIRPYKKAVLQATSPDPSPPSETAVKSVLAAVNLGGNTADKSTPIGALLPLLRTRIATPHWAIALKTEILFHAIFRSGRQRFLIFLADQSRDTFDRDNFDHQSPDGIIHTPFIRVYATYLKTWLQTHKHASFPPLLHTSEATANRFKTTNITDLQTSLPHLATILELLPDLPLPPPIQTSPTVRPALEMLLHDIQTLLTALRTAIPRLISLFFNLPPEHAVPAHTLYQRFLALPDKLSLVLETLSHVDPRWQIPELTLNPDIELQMQVYIAEGCEHHPQPDSLNAVRVATAANNLPATNSEINAVLILTKEKADPASPNTPAGAVIAALRDSLRSSDWRVVAKALILFRSLLDGADIELVGQLCVEADMFENSFAAAIDTEIDGAQQHLPLLSWFARFIRTRCSTLYHGKLQRATSNDTAINAEKLLSALPRGLDLLDELAIFYVADDLHGKLADSVYAWVVKDVTIVFVQVVRRMNDVVGLFFELEIGLAVQALAIYERFIVMFGRAGAEGGMFERAKTVCPAFRKPDEVVVCTDVVADMRMHIELARRGGGPFDNDSNTLGIGLGLGEDDEDRIDKVVL